MAKIKKMKYADINELMKWYIAYDGPENMRDETFRRHLLTFGLNPTSENTKQLTDYIVESFKQVDKIAAETEDRFKTKEERIDYAFNQVFKTNTEATKLREDFRDASVNAVRSLNKDFRSAANKISLIPDAVLIGLGQALKAPPLLGHHLHNIGSWVAHASVENLRAVKNKIVHEKIGGFFQDFMFKRLDKSAIKHDSSDLIVTPWYIENTLSDLSATQTNIQARIAALDKMLESDETGKNPAFSAQRALKAKLESDNEKFQSMIDVVKNPELEAKWWQLGEKRKEKDKYNQVVKACNIYNQEYDSKHEIDLNKIVEFAVNNKGLIRQKREEYEANRDKRDNDFKEKYMDPLQKFIDTIKGEIEGKKDKFATKENELRSMYENIDLNIAETRATRNGSTRQQEYANMKNSFFAKVFGNSKAETSTEEDSKLDEDKKDSKGKKEGFWARHLHRGGKDEIETNNTTVPTKDAEITSA